MEFSRLSTIWGLIWFFFQKNAILQFQFFRVLDHYGHSVLSMCNYVSSEVFENKLKKYLSFICNNTEKTFNPSQII